MHPSLVVGANLEPGRVLVMRSDVLAAGGSDRDIRAARRAGQIVRLRAGTYAVRGPWEQLDEVAQHIVRTRGVARKAGCDAVASHVSAAALHRAPLWDLPLDEVHVSRQDGRGGRREAGVVQHRGLLAPHDVVRVGGIPVTAPHRTVIDLSTIADVEHALPVVDDFLHRGLTTPDQLHGCRLESDRWPGTRATDVLLRLADGARESVGESRTFYLMYVGGVPYPVAQFEVVAGQGHVIARLDFAWPELKVWLEFDGRQKYTALLREGEDVVDAVLREKRREERVAGLTGWRCIRLTWSDLRHPQSTAAYINSVLAGGPVHR